MCGIVHSPDMPSPGDRTILKAELERLQKAQTECTDGGIREKIDAWIVEQQGEASLRRLLTLRHLRQAVSARGRRRRCPRSPHAQSVLPRFQNFNAAIRALSNPSERSFRFGSVHFLREFSGQLLHSFRLGFPFVTSVLQFLFVPVKHQPSLKSHLVSSPRSLAQVDYPQF
jgi:hypothetical protein